MPPPGDPAPEALRERLRGLLQRGLLLTLEYSGSAGARDSEWIAWGVGMGAYADVDSVLADLHRCRECCPDGSVRITALRREAGNRHIADSFIACGPGSDLPPLERDAEASAAKERLPVRLARLPVFRIQQIQVPAARFNRVRLLLRRRGAPQRLALPGLRRMALVLDDHYWMVVDGEMNDLPIAAWTGFSARSSLHEPVHCRLRQYHAQAGLLVESVAALLDTMGQPPG